MTELYRKKQSDVMDICFVFDAGNIVNWPRFIAFLDQLDPTKLVVWDTRTSKDLSSSVLQCVVEAANVQWLKAALMANPKPLVQLNNKNLFETSSLSPKNELDVGLLL